MMNPFIQNRIREIKELEKQHGREANFLKPHFGSTASKRVFHALLCR